MFSGHDMSGVDGNSKEGESVYGRSPAQIRSGCYPNYEYYGPSWRRCSVSFFCFHKLSNNQPTTPDRPKFNFQTNVLSLYLELLLSVILDQNF